MHDLFAGPLSPAMLDDERWAAEDPLVAWTRERHAPRVATLTAELPSTHQPVSTAARSANVLRPERFADIVGQERAKALLSRMVEICKRRGVPLDHVLLVGPSGTGKTTFAHVLAAELGRNVYQVEAPISWDTLMELRDTMQDGDVLFVDEIHQQAIQERRGKSSSTQPEVLFSIMEDRTIPTPNGILPFPHITFMGATTDEGMLPDAFINRFPIRPRLEHYSEDELTGMALSNARALGLGLERSAARIFARACRGVPREINNYVKNAAMLSDFRITPQLAFEVIADLNGVTADGLTRDMQAMLVFLYERCKKTTASTGEVIYKSSVTNIATGIGKSRDAKAIQLRVEPYLIEKGYIQVGHGGRWLTDAGINRAKELLS